MLLNRHSKRIPILFLFALLLALSTNGAYAQGQVELGASVTYSGPLRLYRQYPTGLGESDISSASSPGFEAHLGFSRPLGNNFRWIVSAAFGVYSYNLSLYVTDEFNRLGWGGFSDRYTQYEILYTSLQAGVRWCRPIRRNNLVFLQPALRFAYPWRSFSELAVVALPDNGGTRQLFQAEMVNNDTNQILLCPELGLFYQLTPHNGRLGLIAGVSALYSNRYPFSGDYQIVGDNDVLEGSLAKRFLHLGASLSVFWKIDK